MSFLQIAALAVGLSMDAFAISIGKGLVLPRYRLRYSVLCGLYFGLAQALMPVIGFLLGSRFARYIETFDHWVAFLLLGFIGGKMIIDSRKDEESQSGSMRAGGMIILAVATSIDALAVGITFAFLGVDVLYAAAVIGAVTFLICAVGVKIGQVFGSRFQGAAQLLGGVILVLIGLRILLQHMGVLGS